MLMSSTPSSRQMRIVIKVGGAAVTSPGDYASLWSQIATVSREASVAVVHGGGHLATERLDRMGVAQPGRINGLRITPPEMIEDVVASLGGVANARLVSALTAAGATTCGMTLTAARMMNLDHHPTPGLGHVGQVIDGDGTMLLTHFDAGVVPVIAPVGMTPNGTWLNVNADEAAAGVARTINADQLLLLSDIPGVLDADGACINALPEEDLGTLIESGVIAGGMIPKVLSAVSAAKASGSRVHIASLASPTVIRDAVRGHAVGTQVYASGGAA